MPTQPPNLSYIAGNWSKGSGQTFNAWNPVENSALGATFNSNSADLQQAVVAASEAAAILGRKSKLDIGRFLQALAQRIEGLGDELINTAMAETGLPEARLQGERGRTCGQIRAFAELVKEGSWIQASIDTAQADRQPLPKPDLRAMLMPIGPVAVFGASNFPFAFGSLGGDSAAALAAGNPIIVKGHPSHPATSSLFAKAMEQAIADRDFPAGTFSLLQGDEHAIGAELVAHPAIKAVGFTGSVAGGRALMDIAAKRAEPISVYAEMGSINPVFIMPDVLENRSDSTAAGLAASIAMAAGQFCTSPGLVVTLAGDFAEQTATHLKSQAQSYMLNPGIAGSLNKALNKRSADKTITVLAGGADAPNLLQPFNSLMKVNAADFLASPELLEEVFGPVSLLVECETPAQMIEIAFAMEGNLTATIHTDDYENQDLKVLFEQLSKIAGRVLFNGFPTGVEVCPSMQHGGPYPASSAPATSSVGTAAIYRFTSRHSFQNCPENLLPEALKSSNPANIWRQLNGQTSQAAVSE